MQDHLEDNVELAASIEESLDIISGISTDGHSYSSIQDMWRDELGSNNVCSRWYNQAQEYWENEANCPPTVDGVLGGFGSISEVDLDGSRKFLMGLQEYCPSIQFKNGSCCDCGAGIGRVSKGLLLPFGFKSCDLVEVSQRLICAAPDYLGDDFASKCRYLCIGLQDFQPKTASYDLIWIQWVIGHLTDIDCIKFLKRCASGLKENGIICIKDNTCSGEDSFCVDKEDSSITRSLSYLLQLCIKADLKVKFQTIQKDFPPDIYPVPIVALEASRSCSDM